MDNSLGTAAITWRHYALVFSVCLLLWVLLVGTLDGQELLAGALVSALIALLFGSRFNILTGFRFSRLAWRHSRISSISLQTRRKSLSRAKRAL